MRCHEPDALNAVDVVDCFDEVGNTVSERITVRVDILAEQHDFFDAICRKTLDLTYDLRHHAALLPAPGIRNDTVSAEVIAAESDVDESFVPVHPLRLHLILIYHRIVIDDRTLFPTGREPLLEQFRELRNILGPENNVDP